MNKCSIIQDWVAALGLRHQGVLLTAIRGCDGVGKHDLSKPIMRAIRAICLVPYDERELTEPKGFMYYDHVSFRDAVTTFSKNLDEYPMHFILHMLYALEVIGYGHSGVQTSEDFLWAYEMLVRKIHLRPESIIDMNVRLREDRVANGTVIG
jgi:hypothetical protein